MDVDWTLFARYAAPIVALIVGALLNHWTEKRQRLISYMSNASAVTVQLPAGGAVQVHSHSVVVRNIGGKAAQNVRLGHSILPDFSVYPAVNYNVVNLPAGGKEIVFPALVPGEQVTVAYLYFPPVLWSNVNTYTKSDEGFAKIINVLPSQQYPQWLSLVAGILMIVGTITAIYAIGELGFFLYRHFAVGAA